MRNRRLEVNWKHHPCAKTESYEPLVTVMGLWKICTDFNGYPILKIRDLNYN